MLHASVRLHNAHDMHCASNFVFGYLVDRVLVSKYCPATVSRHVVFMQERMSEFDRVNVDCFSVRMLT